VAKSGDAAGLRLWVEGGEESGSVGMGFWRVLRWWMSPVVRWVRGEDVGCLDAGFGAGLNFELPMWDRTRFRQYCVYPGNQSFIDFVNGSCSGLYEQDESPDLDIRMFAFVEFRCWCTFASYFTLRRVFGMVALRSSTSVEVVLPAVV
jgi:hypothetical protein